VTDNYDSCLSCGIRIPPGPSFCSLLCERAHDLAAVLHDLYGHTFDLPGFEAIKFALESYAKDCPDCGQKNGHVGPGWCLGPKV
jgi:predicted RNA-binding Zn-ribbon protein involved in translation (DUF1610 family)